jgi:hypothetical protein
MKMFDLRINLADAVFATVECTRIRAAAAALVVDTMARIKAAP